MSELAQESDAGVTGEAYCPHCFLQVANDVELFRRHLDGSPPVAMRRYWGY